MKKEFSTKWKSSKRPGKQRKYAKKAPIHTRRKFLSAHLSADLRKRHSRRSFPLTTGDKIKVIRGQFKGRENKIERVDHKKIKIYVTGIERTKKDGSKSIYPLRPSNVLITELNLDDKKRKEALEKSKKSGSKKPQKAATEAAKKPEAKPAAAEAKAQNTEE